MTEPVVVKIPGPHVRSDINNELKDKFIGLINEDKNRLVLDFDEVQFIDSSSIGLLIIILKKATSKNGDVKLCCLKQPLLKIFNAMRLNRLFEIYETPEGAVDSFDR